MEQFDFNKFEDFCDEMQISEDEEKNLIGKIHFTSNTVLEQKVGHFKPKGIDTLYIHVYSNEGENIPHVHITDNPNGYGEHIDFCIRLDINKTFMHGSHNKTSTGVLTSKFNKAFNKIMRSITTIYNRETGEYNEITVWKKSVILWNEGNNNKISLSEIPDYTKLY